MKRFFAIFICSIIIFCHFVPIVPGQAAEVVIENGIDILYKGWDMINALINGFVIQTSPYSQLANDGTAYAAYYTDWGKDLLEVTSWGFQTDPDSESSAISLQYPLDLGMTGSYYNNFVNTYLQYVQDANNGFSVPLTGNSLAAWNRFNNSFINRYLKAFRNESVVVNPDQEYIPYIEVINNSLLSLSNIDFNAEISDHRYSYASSYGTLYAREGGFYTASDGSYVTIHNVFQNVITIDINSSGDFYSYSITNQPTYTNNFWFNPQGWYSNAGRWIKGQTNYVEGANINIAGFGTPGTGVFESYTYSGTLESCMYDIMNKFKNVNINVNGVPWARAGVNNDVVLAPDVIRNETGQIIGHDVMFPNQDLYVDLINWKTLVEDKLEDGTDITFDDLIDAGVITDSNGDAITDDDVDSVFQKRDIAGVIAEELDDAVADDFVPNAPEPPDIDPDNWNFPEFPLPDIDGFTTPKTTGLSILARIINVTNQSLPSELITMFWGICITLVILGIIKILHK